MNKKLITITIDGPAGSGKGTTAKELAVRLDYNFLNTGAIYRAVTLYCLNNEISFDDPRLPRVLESIDINFDENNHTLLNGKDVEKLLHTQRIHKHVSTEFARVPVVRKFVTLQSQKIIAHGGYILDGRDAGTVIAPNAELKIYLDATAHERARRRALDLGFSESEQDIDTILETIINPRDLADKQNLGEAKNISVLVDTSEMTIDQQVETIYQLALEKIN